MWNGLAADKRCNAVSAVIPFNTTLLLIHNSNMLQLAIGRVETFSTIYLPTVCRCIQFEVQPSQYSELPNRMSY